MVIICRIIGPSCQFYDNTSYHMANGNSTAVHAKCATQPNNGRSRGSRTLLDPIQCPWKLAAVPLVLCPFLLLLIRPSPGDGSSFSSSTVRASGTPVFPPPGSLFSLSTFPVTFLTSTMADKPEKVESMEKIVVVRRISSGCRYRLNSPSRIRISIPWPRAMERIPRISNRECPSTITSLSHDSHSV